MRRLITFLLFAAAMAAHAQAPRVPSQYTRVLLPFHASVPAGSGTWFVQWWFRNDGQAPADVFPLAALCGLPPPGGGVFVFRNPSLPAETTLTCLAGDALPSFPVPPSVPVLSTAPGAFVYVESAARQVRISGTIQLFSPMRNGAAAALNAIPEASFLAGKRSILPVPLTAGRRYAIRVYALPETLQVSPRVQVRIYDLQPQTSMAPYEELAATIPLELSTPPSGLRPCLGPCDLPDVGYVPAVAEAFQIAPPLGFMQRTTLRVEIVPESESLRWWAVVSATDNATNDVSLYEPSR